MDYTDLPMTECLLGSDGEMLCFALDRARAQFAWKTGGLTTEQLRSTHPPSTLTIAGSYNVSIASLFLPAFTSASLFATANNVVADFARNM